MIAWEVGFTVTPQCSLAFQICQEACLHHSVMMDQDPPPGFLIENGAGFEDNHLTSVFCQVPQLFEIYNFTSIKHDGNSVQVPTDFPNSY